MAKVAEPQIVKSEGGFIQILDSEYQVKNAYPVKSLIIIFIDATNDILLMNNTIADYYGISSSGYDTWEEAKAYFKSLFS